MQLLFTVLLLLLIMISSPIAYSANSQEGSNYTVTDLVNAFEAGQFRVIPTGGINLIVSPDGAYVSAYGDGLYRTSDGEFFETFDQTIFSPDGRYLAQRDGGIYRLSDMELIVPIVTEGIEITSRIIPVGTTDFSNNSEYVSISGLGVFRLSDGQNVIPTDVFEMRFSHDSVYLATSQAVYRLNDGEKLFNINGNNPNFSRNSIYVDAVGDGVYRISDGERVIEIPSAVSYTPDLQFAVAYTDGVYRLSDSEKLFSIANDGSWPVFSPNREYIAVNLDGLYRFSDGKKLLDIDTFYPAFSHDGQYLAVANDGVYRLDDMKKLFDITGGSPTFNADDTYLATSGFVVSGELGGVYRMESGVKLLNVPTRAVFSPDGLYVVVNTDGVYRLSDTQKIHPISATNSEFTPDGEYLLTDWGLYRTGDWHEFFGLQILDIPHGIMAIGNTLLVVDPTQEDQHVTFVYGIPYVLANIYSEPDPDSEFLGIGNNQFLVVLDERVGWYQVSFRGETGWISEETVTLITVPEP